MGKKIISIAALIVFILPAVSCAYTTKIKKVPPGGKINKALISKIYAVVTISNDWVQFFRPGRIINDNIKGVVVDKEGKIKTLSIPLSEVKRIWVTELNIVKSGVNILSGIGLVAIFFIANAMH